MFNWLNKLLAWYQPSFLAELGAVVGIASGLNSLFGGDDGGSAASDAAAGAANTSSQISADQWNYYKANYQPLETSLIKQAQEAGSPEEFARARGAASADVTSAFDQSRKQTLNRMQSFGINPASPAYQSAGASIDLAEGATRAGALTAADRNTRNLAYSKGLDVVGLGRGIPAQSAASSANAAGALNQASRVQALQNEANMKNIGYGLNTIGTVADKWFGTRGSTVEPMAGRTTDWLGNTVSASNWGNDFGYAEGGMINAEKMPDGSYDATRLKSVLQRRGLNDAMIGRMTPKHITPHMKGFAMGGGVGMRGMEPVMPNGQVQGAGNGTSDSVPAVINGAEPAKLSDGEFIINKAAVDLSGTEMLEAINRAGLEKRGIEPQTTEPPMNMQGYAMGGRVSRYACGGLARR